MMLMIRVSSEPFRSRSFRNTFESRKAALGLIEGADKRVLPDLRELITA